MIMHVAIYLPTTVHVELVINHSWKLYIWWVVSKLNLHGSSYNEHKLVDIYSYIYNCFGENLANSVHM